MSAARTRRPGLPLWIKASFALGVLMYGGMFAFVGLVWGLMAWGMGNGPQHDTRRLFGADSAAVIHLDGDPEDPGVRAMAAYGAELLPELKAAQRRGQGAPEAVAELDKLRMQGKLLQSGVLELPRQVTATVELGPHGEPASWLAAVNTAAAGRLIGFITSVGDHFAAPEPGEASDQRFVQVEHGGHLVTLRGRLSEPQPWFWGALDSTTVFGEAQPEPLRGAVARITDPAVTVGPLHGAVHSVDPAHWDLWGGALLGPAALSELGVDAWAPCLAELPPGDHPAVVLGVDIVSEDLLRGELALLTRPGAPIEPGQACLEWLCTEAFEQAGFPELRLDCTVRTQDDRVRALFDLEGLRALMDRGVRAYEEHARAG
jgi:hypothetical protein